LLLDELSIGALADHGGEAIAEVREIAKAGLTVLLVQQNARLALRATMRGYGMVSRVVTCRATPKDVFWTIQRCGPLISVNK